MSNHFFSGLQAADYWNPARRYLSEPNSFEAIAAIQLEDISKEKMNIVINSYINNPVCYIHQYCMIPIAILM